MRLVTPPWKSLSQLLEAESVREERVRSLLVLLLALPLLPASVPAFGGRNRVLRGLVLPLTFSLFVVSLKEDVAL